MNCKNCQSPILETYYFCPSCGKKLKEPPFKFSVNRTITIILLSVFLPPLGLIPAIRYFVAPDIKAKIVGIVGIALNAVILTWITIYLINSINQTMTQIDQITNPQGSVENQIQTLQNPTP